MVIEIKTESQIRRVEIPQSWNALTLRQQIICYGILMTDAGAYYEPQELPPLKKIQLIMGLLSLDETFMRTWEEDNIAEMGPEDGHLLFLSELDNILAAANFLFKPAESPITNHQSPIIINLGLTKNPFPILERPHKITKRPVRYFGPADGLENVTIYELGVAFNLFEKFMQTRQESYAITLLATLWRPGKPVTPENKRSAYQGDRRLPYLHHEATVAMREKHIATLPLQVRHLLLFWFASCRQAIVDSYPNVFTGQPQSDGNQYGWGGVLLSLAGGIVHLDAVAQQPHSNALAYLSYLEDERKRAKLKQLSAKK